MKRTIFESNELVHGFGWHYTVFGHGGLVNDPFYIFRFTQIIK